jgi:hypothetical protein
MTLKQTWMPALFVAAFLLTAALAQGNSTTSGATTTAMVTSTTTTSIVTTTTTVAATTTGAPGPTNTTAPSWSPAPPQSFDLNQSCPFSRWGGSPRYCYECRWCPFRESTCCEMEDEIDVLKSVNVSGSADWDCFITIVHFQQCGRCDPNSTQYARDTPRVKYATGPLNFTIRPCLQACKYIYRQCKDANTLTGEPVVPSDVSEAEFCRDAPEFSSPELPCYNAAFGTLSVRIIIGSLLALLLAGSWLG